MAADQTFENYRKPTGRDDFLKTMEAIAPWVALCEVIEPFYPKAGSGGTYTTGWDTTAQI